MGSLKVVEIGATIICFLSLFTNIAAIYLVVSIRKESKTVIGLDLILLLAGYDLVAPITGIAQEALSIATHGNILDNFRTCQILGIIETLIPFISSGVVALLSLDRYLYICNHKLATKSLLIAALLHLSTGLILSILASVNQSYTLIPSKMICSVDPRADTPGRVWFYTLIVFFVIHSFIIIFCYSKIIQLRTKVYNCNSLASSEDSECGINFSMNNLKKPNYSPKQVYPVKFEQTDQPYPSGFVFKTIILLSAYLLCIIPGAGVMIYDAIKFEVFGDRKPISPILSAIMFVPLFTLSLVNPILVLSLHSTVSVKLKQKATAISNFLRIGL